MAASSSSSSSTTLLSLLNHKGPCSASEAVYRSVKEIHRKMISLCKPLSNLAAIDESFQLTLVEPYIVISEEPKVIGLPPGLRANEKVSRMETELGLLHQKIILADRTPASQPAATKHAKCLVVARKVSIWMICQRQQERVDIGFGAVQESFADMLLLEMQGIVDPAWALGEIDKIKKNHHVATAEGTSLAGSCPGGAVLLIPSTAGWTGALKVAKDAKFLKPDFPDLNTQPLSTLAAIEIRQITVQRREGIRRVSAVEGRLRLITTPEYQELKEATEEEATEHVSGKLQLLPVQACREGEDIIPATWVKFPNSLDSSSALLRAEMLEVDHVHLLTFVDSFNDFVSKWRWFATRLVEYLQLRRKYRCRPLNLHQNFTTIQHFTRAFVQCLSMNLMDQIQGEREVNNELKELLETLVEAVNLTEDQFILRTPAIEEEDDEYEYEDEEYEYDDEFAEDHEYIDLEPDVLRPPPLNPDYLATSQGQGTDMGTMTQSRHPLLERSNPPVPVNVIDSEDQRQPSRPPAQRAAPQPIGPNLTERIRRPRSRSNSHDSQVGERGGERGGEGGMIPRPATTASQLRGDDRTHSIMLQLQRCRQVLLTMEADPNSTKYKNQREKVGKMLFLAEKHIREDPDVSASYGDFLVEVMNCTEADCAMKDDELDAAEQKKKRIEGDKKDLLATLPRGLGQKFSGSAADWPAFRHYFEEINDSVSPPLAVAHMTALIDCPKLKKRMKIYRSGDEVLKDFDKDYGFSFLNCATIINEINNLKRATNKSEEMDLILKYRHAKRALDMNADHEKLLNVPLMIQWADQLLPTTCEDLMRIIQEAEFGEQGSALEKYFQHIERVYERNSVLVRNRDARRTPHRPPQPKSRGKKVDWAESDQRSYNSEEQSGEGCPLCKTGPPHRPYNCDLLKAGKVSVKKVKQAGLCTCCLVEPANCKKGVIKRKDGTAVYLTCANCKNSKKLSCHQNCKEKQHKPQHPQGGGVSAAGKPPVELGNDVPAGASITELRTEMSILVNPNSLGTALELVDYALLVAPDGSTMRVRTIYDTGGTDCMIDWKLDRFFHHQVPVTVGVNGATGTRMFASQVGELRILNADGTSFSLKAIKSDLAGRAFTLKRKFVDVPPGLQHHFGPTFQYYNEVGDLRHYNVSDDYQVQLVIGLDAIALSPMELARGQDENGQLMIWRSLISNQVLVSGSRKTGSAAAIRREADQRSYIIQEEGNQPVSLLRTAVDLGAEDSRDLFVKRKNLSKIERKFFRHIEDGDQLVPPQPELCPSCQGCDVCKDPFRARREQTVIKLLDQLVTFKEGPRDQKGGYHIKLIYSKEALERVPEGKEAALRRLLSTERQLLKPHMRGALENFNKKMRQCQERGYLVRPEDYDDLSHLQKSYQPVSFALKDEEVLANNQLQGMPEHKTKARPVIDSSSIAEPGGVSVNAAQYKIPDVHTLKITQILLKLRTAKRFCIGDISEYYFRLFCDELTTSLTRILYREGGLGSQGKIIELVSPVASMGMTEIPTFAAHVRYRISLTIKDEDPVAAKQLRDSYCDDVMLFEQFHECTSGDGDVLVLRAKLVETALNKAYLFLGDRWITDASQEVCGDTMIGVSARGRETEVAIGNSAHTSALGYRLHLGPDHPPGGSLLWRVHRPQSLNLEPKRRGARPEWAQLADSADIREYLRSQGVTKASLLSLCSSLYDPLQLAAVFNSTARQLFRKILREVGLMSWKARVPERYHDLIARLAEDLLEVSKKLKVPRLAVVPNPLASEAQLHPCGFVTLLIISDGSCEAGIASAYVHQMFPYESGFYGQDDDFTDVIVSCRLLCAAVKLTDNKGNNDQVSGELLGKFLACQLKENIQANVLINFHQVRLCSDSLTVERAIRKTDACYSIWAGRRVASIQRSIDVDCSYHVPHEVTDATVDACTKYQRSPSKHLNEKWFEGRGVLDIPIQKLPYTDRAIYAQPRIGDLPSQWLSSAAKTFLGLDLPAVIIMKLVAEEVPEMTLLEQLASKYQSINKAISVLQCLLKMKQNFRQLPVPAQREVCVEKFVGGDYDKVSQQLGKRSTRLTQQLLLENDKEKKVFTLKGRFGYRATLLANPKSSSFSKLVLKDAHNTHHLVSSARIMAKVGRKYAFTGGALKYLDRLRAECHMCRLLKPEAVKMLMGDPPQFMRGLLPDATTSWRYQSTDIFGPWMMDAFPRAKGTRAAAKRIKAWGLLVFDYASRAIEATLLEDYSADSVIMGLKTIWSRVGRPQWLSFDAASNITSAREIVGGQEGLEQPSLIEGERLQKQLQEKLGGQIEIRPRVPYAPFRQVAERGVQFCKRELRRMLQHTAGGLLTPLQASSILSCAVAHINERPLIVHGAPDEMGILTPWFLSARNMSTFHSQQVEEQDNLEHSLSRRAFQAQERLDLFRGVFNVFYHKEMVKFGHWNTQGKRPEVGDVCLILDKVKGKAHFLQKFQLGRIREFTSEHICEVDFVKQNPEVTAALIRDLRSQTGDWRRRYQVKLSSCTRDVRSLAILSSQAQEQRLKKGLEVDLLVTQPGPEEADPDSNGGAGTELDKGESHERQRLRAEDGQQPEGVRLAEPRNVLPEEQRGVRAQLQDPVHTVDGLVDQVPVESDQPPVVDTHQNPSNKGHSDLVVSGSVKPKLPAKKKGGLKEKWVFHK